MVIYQHPSALWAAFKKADSRCEPTSALLPTRIRIKNNGDGTGTARLVEAPTIRRSSFSLFNSSIKQGSKRKLSLTISRRSSDKAVRRDDEGFESGHAQGNLRSRSRFGKFGGNSALPPIYKVTSSIQDDFFFLISSVGYLRYHYKDAYGSGHSHFSIL